MQYQQLFFLSSELKKNFFESKLDFLATFFFSIFLLLAMLEWQFLGLFSKPNILSTFFSFSVMICTLYPNSLVMIQTYKVSQVKTTFEIQIILARNSKLDQLEQIVLVFQTKPINKLMDISCSF